MAKYKALIEFADALDNNKIYHIGEEYTCSDPKRLESLLGTHNVTGAPVIELVEEVEARPTKAKK